MPKGIDPSPHQFRGALEQLHGSGVWICENATRKLFAEIRKTAAARSSGFGLTCRELTVLQFVAQGDSDKEVATRLGIGYYTVKEHLKNAFRKLGVSSRAAAVMKLYGNNDYARTRRHG